MPSRAFSFEAFDSRIRIDTHELSDRQQSHLAGLLPPGSVPATDERFSTRFEIRPHRVEPFLTLSEEGFELATGEFDLVAEVIDQRVREVVALESRSLMFVHAGVVAAGERAVVLPGPSFAGKSTLVAALVRTGCEYFSDEYALLDEAGTVHPYRRAISLRDPAHANPVPQRVETAGTEAARIGLVLQTSYEPGRECTASPASEGAGALMLLSNMIGSVFEPPEALAIVAAASRGALVFTGVRGEADEAAAWILDRLSD